MKKLALVPVLLAGLAMPALANDTTATSAETGAPAKVTITPAPGTTEASAAATVVTSPEPEQSVMSKATKAYGSWGEGRGCSSRKTQALIN